MFSHHSKYGVPLLLNGARYYRFHTLEATATATALHPRYDQSPVDHEDLVSSSKSKRRLRSFEAVLVRLTSLVGRNPAVKGPQAPNTTWLHLFSLATSPGQMESVAQLFPRWREGRRAFNTHIGDMFIRRCAELRCPLLALQIFGDHSKYGVPLSLNGARHLLYSLHRFHPLEATATAAALYPRYDLPPVDEDLVSCAILTSACLLHPTNEYALVLAKVMIPSLKNHLVSEKSTPSPPLDPAKAGLDRPNAWLRESLRKIEHAVAELRLKDTEALANADVQG